MKHFVFLFVLASLATSSSIDVTSDVETLHSHLERRNDKPTKEELIKFASEGGNKDNPNRPMAGDIPLPVDLHVPLEAVRKVDLPPIDPMEMQSIQEAQIVGIIEEYAASLRNNLKPHKHCKLSDPNSKRHHYVCVRPEKPFYVLDFGELRNVHKTLTDKYHETHPEGCPSVTSFFKEPGFAQSGDVRFKDGVQDKALFWTLEHGPGCAEGEAAQWCLTVMIKDTSTDVSLARAVTVDSKEKSNFDLSGADKQAKADKPADRPVKPADQPVKPADQPVKPADQPVKPAGAPAQPPASSKHNDDDD